MTELTTTSYAVLGLLALRQWTTYELAQQMERSLNRFWPRAVSKLYEEPKKLVAHGLAVARKERTGRRPRTVYTITPQGRRALRRWLDTRGDGPTLEFEGILKVFYADQGSKEQLLANLRAIQDRMGEQFPSAVQVNEEYLDTGGPFPERLHIIGLMMAFLNDFYLLVYRWAQWAEREVQRWPGATAAGRPRVAREVFERGIKEVRDVGGERINRDSGGAGADLGDRQRSLGSSPARRKRRSADDRKSQRPARRRNDVGVR